MNEQNHINAVIVGHHTGVEGSEGNKFPYRSGELLPDWAFAEVTQNYIWFKF